MIERQISFFPYFLNLLIAVHIFNRKFADLCGSSYTTYIYVLPIPSIPLYQLYLYFSISPIPLLYLYIKYVYIPSIPPSHLYLYIIYTSYIYTINACIPYIPLYYRYLCSRIASVGLSTFITFTSVPPVPIIFLYVLMPI